MSADERRYDGGGLWARPFFSPFICVICLIRDRFFLIFFFKLVYIFGFGFSSAFICVHLWIN